MGIFPLISDLQTSLGDNCTASVPSFDPVGSWDYAAYALNGILLFVALIHVLWGLFNHAYFPLQYHQPFGMTLQFTAGVIWAVAVLFVNDNYQPDLEIGNNTYCVLRRYLFEITLGFCLWISCIIDRILQVYYRVVVHKKKLNSYATILLLMLPLFIYSLITGAVQSDRSCLYTLDDGSTRIICNVLPVVSIVGTILHLAYFITALAFIIRLRKFKRSPFLSKLRIEVFLAKLLYLVVAALNFAKVERFAPGRFFQSFLIAVIVSHVAIHSFGYPMYRSIKGREEYEKEFRELVANEEQTQEMGPVS